MSAKKKHEFRERDYSRNSEGLKQRRLKDEARWKFNPNEEINLNDDVYDDEEDWFYDSNLDRR